MDQRFCTECGAPIKPGANFCFSCGAPLQYRQTPEEPAAPQPVAEQPAAPQPVFAAPIEETPAVEVPVPEAPVFAAPVEEAPAEEVPVPEAPVFAAPTEEIPAEEVPAPEAPVFAAPIEEIPAEEVPASEAPVFAAPAEDIPAEEVPAPEAPVFAAPMEEIPAVEVPAPEAPVFAAPAEDIPAVEVPAPEAPVFTAPVEEAPAEPAPAYPAAGQQPYPQPGPVYPTPAYPVAGQQPYSTPAYPVAGQQPYPQPAPAYQPPAAPAPVKQTAKKEKAPKKRPAVGVRILLAVISVLLCVLLFACLCAGEVLYTARTVVTPESVSKAVDDLDLMHRDIRPFINSDAIPQDQKVTVTDYMYDFYRAAYSQYTDEQLEISRKEMEDLLKDSTLEEFLKKKINDYLSDATGNTGTGKVTKEEILDLIGENEEVISRATGYPLSQYDYDSISAELDKIDLEKALDLSAIRREEELPFTLATHLFSWYALAAVAFVCLIWVLLLILVNKYRISNVLLYSGIALVAAGLVGVAAKLLQITVIRRIVEAVELEESWIRPLVQDLLDPLWKIGLIVAGTGALLILIFTVIRLVQRSKANKI